MSTVPSGTRFIGISQNVNLQERKSSVLNAETQPYTIQDIANTVGAGAQGPQGVQGPAGPLGPVGPAGLNWQGSWVSGTSYVADDAVGYNGASWFCILATSGTTAPDIDTTHWALLASQGAQGIQGVQGPTGAQGPAGGSAAQTNGIMYLVSTDSPYQTLSYDINRINLSGNCAVRLPASAPIGKEISVFIEAGTNTLNIFGDNVLNLPFPFLMGSANQQTGTFTIFSSESYVFISLGSGLWKVNTISKTIMSGSAATSTTTKTLINATNVSVLDTTTLLGNTLFKDSLRFNRDNGSGTTKRIDLLSPNNIVDNRTITLPDASGTIALTSNIPTPAYTKYVGTINQTGTGNPAVLVLENTIGNIVWTRTGVGAYEGNLLGAFPVNSKVWFAKPNVQGSGLRYNLTFFGSNPGVVYLYQYANDNTTLIDGIDYASLEIRVYP